MSSERPLYSLSNLFTSTIIAGNDVIATVYEIKDKTSTTGTAMPQADWHVQLKRCRYCHGGLFVCLFVCLFVVIGIILFVMYSLISILSSPLPVDEVVSSNTMYQLLKYMYIFSLPTNQAEELSETSPSVL